MTSRYFKSKVDRWFYLTLIAAALAVLSPVFVTLVGAQNAPPVPWSIWAVCALGIGLPLWLLMSTGYTLEDARLLVKTGPFSWVVPIAEIQSVTPTRNPLSSPALSLDRLLIKYGANRRIMISPADKEGFLRELTALQARLRTDVRTDR